MKLRILLTLAWRNLWRNTRRTLLTATTVSLGLALLLIFLGLGDGGHKQMIESAVRMGSGNVVIQAPGYQELGGLERTVDSRNRELALDWLQGQRNGYSIEEAVSRTFSSALASSADGSAGIQLIGIEPDLEKRVSSFAGKVSEGEFLLADDRDLVVVGHGVARKLELQLGEKMVLMAQGAGSDEIQSRLVRIKGILKTGQEQFDQILVLAPLNTCQEFLRLEGQVHQIAVILEDFEESEELAIAGAGALGSVEVLSWQEALPELREFIVVDDGGNYVFHTFLFLLIGFMVLETLLMSVLERQREFSLLDALGLSPLGRFSMVVFEALFIALVASALGLSLGYAGHHYLATRGLPMDVFTTEEVTVAGVAFDPVMYSYLTWSRIVQAISVVFLLTLVLSFLPAVRAARKGKVQILGSQ